MYTQEIVCPKCGKKTVVNVLDTRGSTPTPCQHCHSSITVSTDKEGKVSEIKGGCFIATACTNAIGDEEQGQHELSILRGYRDSYVRRLSFGGSLLEEYYAVAPRIVSSILSQENSTEILSEMHKNYIQQAVRLIETGKKEEALEIYFQLMEKLKSSCLP